ncbi:hypothetical protein GGR51DRAFT_564010 [Nemania sp. FL0031]|nr:hypothetical protein GGR51DRAFT_564010 [Nemania sp. FL0031]
MASSPKRRALEFLRQKLNATKELQKEKYGRVRFHDSSPPPPLGQASGPVDERIRRWCDEYGFDGDGSSSCPAYDWSRANSVAHVTALPTSRRTSCASIISGADASSISDLYSSGLEYSITSISDTSVSSDGASFIGDASIISSISSHSSPSTSATETIGRISPSHEEDSPMSIPITSTTMWDIVALPSICDDDHGASGVDENGGDESPEWSILPANGRLVRLGRDALNANHMGYAAIASTSAESVAVNENLEAQSSLSPLATTPPLLRIHPLFAAMYGNDPNWAFWPRDDIQIGHVHEGTPASYPTVLWYESTLGIDLNNS